MFAALRPCASYERELQSRERGHARIIATLGSGGMADVFLAARTGPGDFTKLVVIKRLRAELARQKDAPRPSGVAT